MISIDVFLAAAAIVLGPTVKAVVDFASGKWVVKMPGDDGDSQVVASEETEFEAITSCARHRLKRDRSRGASFTFPDGFCIETAPARYRPSGALWWSIARIKNSSEFMGRNLEWLNTDEATAPVILTPLEKATGPAKFPSSARVSLARGYTVFAMVLLLMRVN